MKRVVIALITLGCMGLSAAPPAQYTITQLPTLGGDSLAQRINAKGEIVGESFLFKGPPHAALWYRGAVTDLGTLGGDVSIANDINNSGQIVGYSQLANGATRSFLWKNGVMVNIGTLGTAATYAFGINQHTEIVGFSRIAGGGSPYHAFMWRDGAFNDLGTLGGPESFAYDINDRGWVVGESPTATPGESHAFLWRDGRMTDLGTLAGGGGFSAAYAINESGTIVGASLAGDGKVHAFQWDKGRMTDLGMLPGGAYSSAVGINPRGEIVGINSSDPKNGLPRSAVLWYKSVTTQLPSLGGSDNFANDVNASGKIVGASSDSTGFRHAVIWTP